LFGALVVDDERLLVGPRIKMLNVKTIMVSEGQFDREKNDDFLKM